MTLIGKILVLLNVALSLALAIWALGVYTQRVDWSSEKGDFLHAQGELAKRRERLAPKSGYGLWDELTASESRWRASSRLYKFFEPLRASNDAWFKAQYEALKADKPDPIKVPTYKDGQLVFDPQFFGRLVLADAKDKNGQPLRGLAGYVREYNEKQVGIKLAMDELDKWIKEDSDLTAKLSGEGSLRQRIDQEDEKRRRIVAEQDYLKPLLVNSLVEGELLLKRQNALEVRIKELGRVGVASSR